MLEILGKTEEARGKQAGKSRGKKGEESRQGIIKRSPVIGGGTTGRIFRHSGDLIGGDVVSKIGGCIVCGMLRGLAVEVRGEPGGGDARSVGR